MSVASLQSMADRFATKRRCAGGLLLLALVAGCGDDAKGSAERDASTQEDAGAGEPKRVTIRFKAKVGDDDFACDREYEGLGTTATRVVPVDLRVFVQDVKLLRARDGREVPLELDERKGVQRTDVTLLDFENNRGTCVGAGGTDEINTTVTGFVPDDDYAGIAFSNGVPEDLNHQSPIDLTAPLVAGPLHWNWLGGFLFINAQLREVEPTSGGFGDLLESGVPEEDAGSDDDAGMDGDGGVAPDGAGSAIIHIGSTLCSPNRGCMKSNRNRVVFERFDHERDAIVLDVAKMFADVDLQASTTCHAVGTECEVFFPALGLDYETGAPAEQQIYRVE